MQQLLNQIDSVIVGKQGAIRLAVTCLLANGHLLIEDVPGVGKTTLAHALAKSLGLRFHRVQFTADLMPSDLTGVSIYDRAKEQWIYHVGPLFTQVLLADEINRASPKTQSALLEAMVSECRNRGDVIALYLLTQPDLEPRVFEFYESLGFRERGRDVLIWSGNLE